ncbi:MAG: XdhC family protein [Acidimicrobiales bacterium]|nr:XdhC family protein [Acidimicrobiales bacterium]
MQEVAEVVSRSVDEGRKAVIGRVIELKGFSTLPVDELVAIDDAGGFHGELLGAPGAERLRSAAAAMGFDRLETVPVEIHGPMVKQLGLACGGRADVLLQPVLSIPHQVWSLLAARAPVAMVTMIDGPGAGPAALAVDRAGQTWGALEGGGAATSKLAEQAHDLLLDGRTASRRVEAENGVALIEAWVPSPRLVVIGSGEVVTAIEAQAGLLGWESRAADTAEPGEVEELLDWAGATAALIVLSHDPHVDTPALATGLARPTPYIGAMGSRGTQSRRLQRLAAEGVPADQLDRIHRPIGLNLGGRRGAEVALAIVAEILSCHYGRDARPLRDISGPIHG